MRAASNINKMVTCVVHPPPVPAAETFIRAHVERLPGEVVEIVNNPQFYHQERSKWFSFLDRAIRRARVELHLNPGDSRKLARRLKHSKVEVVLAEYGTTAVACIDACLMAGVPLVPIFHGYDASKESVITRHHDGYKRLFKECPAIIGVSKAMIEKLVEMGAPREKVHHVCYGVDTKLFAAIKPEKNPPKFIGIGRFVEKKAPFLTILAFDRVLRNCPETKLTIAGDGPLLDACRDLVRALGLEEAVQLPGNASHNRVASLMKEARAFVQHSVRAPSGDSEGTPVAILEAGASGLPVIATRHAGIPDVVINEETGLLVDEYDIKGMAKHMTRLAKEPGYAGELGRRAAMKITKEFNLELKIEHLASILREVALG